MSPKLRQLLDSSLFRGGALSVLIQGQFVAVQLLTGIILARTLGPSQFGIYSFALAIMTLVMVMPNSGLDNIVIRYSAEYHAKADWSKLQGLWRFSFSLAAGYGALAAVILIITTSVGALPPSAAFSPQVLAVTSLPLILLPSMTALGAALRAITPGVIGQLPQFAIRPWSYAFLLIAIVTLSRGSLTPKTAMYAQGAATLLAILIGGLWVKQRNPMDGRTLSPARYEFKRWLSSLGPYSLMGGLMLINTQADLLILGTFGTARDTGLYRVAANGANLVSLSLIAANLFIAPRISSLYTAGASDDLQRLITMTVRATSLLAAVTALLFWFDGRNLLTAVFGENYGQAFAPLAILCAGQLFNVFTGSVAVILNMTGNETSAASMAAVAAALNVTLNIGLVPIFGSIGAASATTLTMCVWNVSMLLKVRTNTKIHASLFNL